MVSEICPQDIIKLENGEFNKMRERLPSGAASNLADLISQAYELSQQSIHSYKSATSIVLKLVSIQDAVLKDKLYFN